MSGSCVNITPGEAKKHPECILDPLRVCIKPAVAAGAGVKKEATVEDNSDKNNRFWSVLLSFGRIPRDEMGLIHIYQE
jgi:hypothetical protein